MRASRNTGGEGASRERPRSGHGVCSGPVSGTGRRLASWVVASAVALLAVLGFASNASALELDPVGTFDAPLYVTSDPNDPDRIFVVEQQGRIELLDHGVQRHFLDIHDFVVGGGEQGLFSMAFDPGYATNHRFYVYYTLAGSGNLRIEEYTSNASGNAVPVSSRRPLLTIDHHEAGNHNGGNLQIGPDGYLYAATGDGGNEPANGQNLNVLLGKMLRIDPDHAPAPSTAPYTIPPGNPFAGTTPGRDEIWSYGLRNPWRFSFDSATGALVIGDVGEGAWEEINYRPQAIGGGRGTNFGWTDCEGNRIHGSSDPCNLPGHVNPVFQYDHDHRCCRGSGCPRSRSSRSWCRGRRRAPAAGS